MRLQSALQARLKGVSNTPGVLRTQILRFTADSVPRKRCHAISAKAGELRSTVSQGLQGLSPEELQARQLRQQQLQQLLAQQQAQRLQEQQEMQVSFCSKMGLLH